MSNKPGSYEFLLATSALIRYIDGVARFVQNKDSTSESALDAVFAGALNSLKAWATTNSALSRMDTVTWFTSLFQAIGTLSRDAQLDANWSTALRITTNRIEEGFMPPLPKPTPLTAKLDKVVRDALKNAKTLQTTNKTGHPTLVGEQVVALFLTYTATALRCAGYVLMKQFDLAAQHHKILIMTAVGIAENLDKLMK